MSANINVIMCGLLYCHLTLCIISSITALHKTEERALPCLNSTTDLPKSVSIQFAQIVQWKDKHLVVYLMLLSTVQTI
jgi:hypothetical protein